MSVGTKKKEEESNEKTIFKVTVEKAHAIALIVAQLVVNASRHLRSCCISRRKYEQSITSAETTTNLNWRRLCAVEHQWRTVLLHAAGEDRATKRSSSGELRRRRRRSRKRRVACRRRETRRARRRGRRSGRRFGHACCSCW